MRTLQTNKFTFTTISLWFCAMFFLLKASITLGQYCVPTYTYNSDYIATFATIGTPSDFSYTPNFTQEDADYVDLSANSAYHIKLYQGGSGMLNVEYSDWPWMIRIWIDVDGNSQFDNTEVVYTDTIYNYDMSENFTLPSNIGIGTYRMRVRSTYGIGAPLGPCENGTYGQVVDFTLEVLPLLNCTGTPNAGVVSVTPNKNEAGSSYVVSSLGYTHALDLTYTWESRINGGTWTPEYTGSSYQDLTKTATGNLGDQIEYRLTLVCGSGGTHESNIEAFTIGYCVPTYTVNSDYIATFATIGTPSDFSYTPNSTQEDADYVDLSANSAYHIKLYQGGSGTLNVEYSDWPWMIRIWIDVDGNSQFDNTEVVYTDTIPDYEMSENFTLPSNIGVGTYHMRVRSTYGIDAPLGPCENGTYGQVVDFTLEVLPLLNCTGTPNAGVVSVTPNENVVGSSYVVSSLGFTNAIDLTYTWESRTNGGTWTPEYTGSSYQDLTKTATGNLGDQIEYRLTLVCGGGGTHESNIEAFTIGYCVPIYTSTSDYIATFRTADATNNVVYTASSQPSGGYDNLSGTTIEQVAGTNINFSRTHDLSSHTLRIWVDWNGNGTFESTEIVYQNTGNATDTNGVMNLAGSTAGIYRMRLRSLWGSSLETFDACESLSWGSVIDYTLELTSPPACTGTPNAGVVSITPNENVAGSSYVVSSLGFTNAIDLTYTWESRTNGGTWALEYTGSSYQALTKTATGNLGDQIEYRLTLVCGSGGTHESNIEAFTIGYCVPIYTSTSDYIATFRTADATNNVVYTASSQPSGGYDNLSGTTIEQVAGTNINFSRTHDLPSHTLRIWVDWNGNGTFESTEIVYQNTGNATDTNGVMNLAGSTAGTYRMRLRSLWGISLATFDACESLSLGSAIDYTLELTSLSSCSPITGLTTSEVTTNSVKVSWTAGGTETAWNVEYGTAGFTLGSGTTVTVNNTPETTLSDLSANTAYDIYVTADCGSGNLSSSEMTNVTTNSISPPPTCSPITGLTTSEVTTNSVKVSWTAGGTETAWNVEYGTAGFTLGSGTTVTVNNTPETTLSGLSANTAYDIYVTADCGSGNTSTEAMTNVTTSANFSTGVYDINLISGVSLYPNPTKEEITIEFTLQDVTNVQIVLLDMNGKLLASYSPNDAIIGINVFNINVSEFANGIYSVVIRSDETQSTHKVVIEK